MFYGQWINLHDRSQNGPKLVTNVIVWYCTSSNIHVNINNVGMWAVFVKQWRLGLFQDSDFAGDLEDSKSISGRTLCVVMGSGTRREEWWIDILPWYRLVGVAKNSSETQKKEKSGCPCMVSGHQVVWRRQSSFILEVRPDNKQGYSSLWTAPSAPECGHIHKALVGDQRPTQGGRSSTKTVLGSLGSLSIGSPDGRSPPHGDGSMYSQANVKAGKKLRTFIRALLSVFVDTEKVLRWADGHVEMWFHKECASVGKAIAPGVRFESRTSEVARSPKITSGDKRLARLISYIHDTCEYKQYCYVV